METKKTFTDELSTWSKNGLSRLFGRDIRKDPELIADISMDGLELAIGLGPKSLQEIVFNLCKYGFISDFPFPVGFRCPLFILIL
jgi:hypothetical protein